MCAVPPDSTIAQRRLFDLSGEGKGKMGSVRYELGRVYAHKEVQDTIGGNHQFYLPFRNGRILCGRFTPEKNASAPEIVFVGTKDKNIELAATFAGQREPVPVFIKQKSNCWEYVGEFVVDRYLRDPMEVKPFAAEANRAITGVPFLKRVK